MSVSVAFVESGGDLDEILAEVSTAKLEDLEKRFVDEWLSGARRQWTAGMILWRLDRESQFARHTNPKTGQPFRSVTEWVESLQLAGLKSKATVSKMLQVIRWWTSLPENDKGKWLSESMFDTYDVLPIAKDPAPDKGPGKAHAIVSSAKTSAQKRQAVREITGEAQHHDASGLRTFSLHLTEDTLKHVRQAMNAIRHQLGVANPSDNDVMDRWAADFLSGFAVDFRDGGNEELAGIDDEIAKLRVRRADLIWELLGDQGAEDMRSKVLEDVLAGRCRCLECGAWWPVQYHHVIPRSHPIKGKDPSSPEWPRAPLCASHHQGVTEAHDGNWRVHLRRWMDTHKWLREQVEEFLGNRKIEEV